MILSNTQIHNALDETLVVIDPKPYPRLPTTDSRWPYQTSFVDLTLGDEVSYIDSESNKLPVFMDLTAGDYSALFAAHSRTLRLSNEQPYHLNHRKFALGKTRERVTLNILDGKKCVAARVEGRSSYARCGLLVHFTALLRPILATSAISHKI